MNYLWENGVEMKKYSQLCENIEIDTAIIGGGIAGLLTAFILKQRGINAVVFEGSRICSGQTRGTTAKITAQHDLIYSGLIKHFGADFAKKYYEANTAAIKKYKSIITENRIDCDFTEKPAYLYSCLDAIPLIQECEAAKSIGIDAEFVKETELPFSVKGALMYKNQAQLHPLKFIKFISEKLTIYENTFIEDVGPAQNGISVLRTARNKIKAKNVIFASHYPFINTHGFYYLRLHQERSYVLALKNAMQLSGMYLGIDSGSFSLRDSGDLLLFGGEQHRTGDTGFGGHYEKLRLEAKKLFPENEELFCWSAQDCITPDSVPYIGQYSEAMSNWYVMTGFNKWGMTSSMVSAMLISDILSGTENSYSEVFNPKRFKITAAIKDSANNIANVSKGLAKEFLTRANEKITSLKPGQGGIVDCNGDKAGVYKNENNKLYIVDTRCPHLGCQLEWNQGELSWDCPCHGSRFDYEGNRIDNPAMRDLKKY